MHATPERTPTVSKGSVWRLATKDAGRSRPTAEHVDDFVLPAKAVAYAIGHRRTGLGLISCQNRSHADLLTRRDFDVSTVPSDHRGAGSCRAGSKAAATLPLFEQRRDAVFELVSTRTAGELAVRASHVGFGRCRRPFERRRCFRRQRTGSPMRRPCARCPPRFSSRASDHSRSRSPPTDRPRQAPGRAPRSSPIARPPWS